MKTLSATSIAIAISLTLSFAALGDNARAILDRRSPAPQPYAYVSGGRLAGTTLEAAPDPMASYVWDAPKADDKLQVYAMIPKSATDKTKSGSFANLESATTEDCAIKVNGPGTIMLDFGVELPAWLEIDSPDLAGKVTLGVSEYNEVMQIWPEHRGPLNRYKTDVPEKVAEHTYRLVVNKELYEGVRFAFINVVKFERPFTITAIRAMCQCKPANYTGSFASDNAMLDRIWYVAAWDVRANLREDCIGAILVNRGDRFSWTGDAYTSQAASLVAFSNYDEVLKNLRFTECHRNNIETYELYWIESLRDYYMYSGDAEGVRSLLPQALSRLDHAAEIFESPDKLRFVGWDERLGRGFDHENCDEGKRTQQMLSIGAWKHFAEVLDSLGEGEKAEHYRKVAAEKTKWFLDNVGIEKLGMHSSADAINSDLVPDLSSLCHRDFHDRLARLSYSPFNHCFLIDAMAHAGLYREAFASIFDIWGGQIELGGTCFFEVYRPDWNKIIPVNGPLPWTQCGPTSLAHPWGAAVLTWLTEEMLGIKPVAPGFAKFSVAPHFAGYATRVSGKVSTPHGQIEASFDMKSGRHFVVVPQGTTASVSIPKERMRIVSIAKDGSAANAPREDEKFVYFEDLPAGRHEFSVDYSGTPTAKLKEEYVYDAKFVGEDRETHGEWYRKFGKDGFLIAGGDGDNDLVELPDYVESVEFDFGDTGKRRKFFTRKIKPLDERARLATNRDGTGPKAFACYHSKGCNMCPVHIKLKEKRPFQVSVYVADCSPGGRSLSIDAIDFETKKFIAPSVRVDDLSGGVYLTFSYDKSITLVCNNIRGDNAVINGLFFGVSAQAPLSAGEHFVFLSSPEYQLEAPGGVVSQSVCGDSEP